MQEGERFSSTEENIVEYILAHPAQISEMTTRELAEKTYTSPAAIFRLCQKLGLKGYNEFKIKFTSEVNRTLPCGAHIMHRPITDKDSTSDIIRMLAQLEIEAIEETKNEMDAAQMERIANILDKAAIIDIYAYDQNYSLAQMAVYNFLQVKKTAHRFQSCRHYHQPLRYQSATDSHGENPEETQGQNDSALRKP